ncbi:MAG TPA: nucleotidyltransferase family protein [Stellaceae bacterium]|nr:nucleotidyltransferase family protein [Stellaceae bacterium]
MSLPLLLREPGRITRLTLEEWDDVIPQARSSGILSRLATLAQADKDYWELPEPPRRHMEADQLLAAKHRRDVLYELDRIYEVVGGVLGTIVLLKGAAYLAADLPASEGRTFNDIDILVPEDRLGAVESLLQLAGWRTGEIHPYDDTFYRRWMHQIPPLTHGGRRTTIDVHHSLVPRTARVGAVTAAHLMGRIRRLPDRPGFAVLAPEDMVLHSATHLFNEGEFGRGLRDLTDLDLLLSHFGNAGFWGFWPRLVHRAEGVGLTRPLFYALRYCARLLGTAVPIEVEESVSRFRPPWPILRAMDFAFARALAPDHKSCRDGWTEPALFALYVRSHYLRMPLHLLVPHLVRKATRREAYHSAEASA